MPERVIASGFDGIVNESLIFPRFADEGTAKAAEQGSAMFGFAVTNCLRSWAEGTFCPYLAATFLPTPTPAHRIETDTVGGNWGEGH